MQINIIIQVINCQEGVRNLTLLLNEKITVVHTCVEPSPPSCRLSHNVVDTVNQKELLIINS
jgi:septum formation inhibitor-activating ATPase MinD